MKQSTTSNGRVHPSSHKATRKQATPRASAPVVPIGPQDAVTAQLAILIRLAEDYLKEYGRQHEFGHDLDGYLPTLRLYQQVLEADVLEI